MTTPHHPASPPIEDEPAVPPPEDEPAASEATDGPARAGTAEPEPVVVGKEPEPEAGSMGPEAVVLDSAPEAESVVPEPVVVQPGEAAEDGRGVPPPPGQAPRTPAPRAPSPPGRILEGVVTRVTSDEVELTLDDGRPAVINRRNFGTDDEDPATVLSVNDRAFGAELARDDPKQRVVLSRAWALKRQAWDRVLAAATDNTTISGRVVSVGAKGVVVDVGVRGFVPTSHLELEPVADLGPYADQVLELRVLEAEPRRERLVLSRRSLLLREQRKKAQEMLATLRPGEVRHGRITSLTDYGAFVDLGGVSGLVHLSELSWHRVRKPGDVVALGDEVAVQILDVKAKKRRVSLSIRRLTPDPLTQLIVGDVMVGRVTKLVDFGAFVSLGEVEGLVHLSELAEFRVISPDEIVAPGDEVGVKILSVDRRRRRVELSIRQAAEYGG
ncbi:MAG: S1 RNA-binding domain-containing protein [Acidimicrobiales bacterium]